MLESLKQPRRLLFRTLLLAFVLFVLTGCFEEYIVNVAWLPDSSGIIFADKIGTQVVRYDLARRARKVLVQDTNRHAWQVAVNPEGTRFAYAKVIHSTRKDSDTSDLSYQVTTGDLDGQKQKQSSFHNKTTKLVTKAAEASNSIEVPAITLTLSAQKLLIHCISDNNSMIYDCESDKWTEIGAAPCFGFSNGGVRPDGLGFLTETRSPVGLSFVTLDGWISEFRDKPEGKRFFATEWDKNIARFVSLEGIDEFDTENMTHTFKKSTVDALPGDGDVTWFYRFPKSDMRLCAYQTKDKDEKKVWRLEAQIQAGPKRKFLVKEGECDLSMLPIQSYPSPDGKKIAIYHVHNGKILIIDNTGEIVDTITTQMVEPK